MTGPRLIFLHFMTPIQKIMQHIARPDPRVTSAFVNRLVPTLEDGDILLSREEWHLTNPFVPGFWGHAAIVHGSLAVEAIGEGVVTQDLYRWLYQKDSVAVLRPNVGREQRKIAAEIAKGFADRGIPYDYGFEPGDKSFYCSELVAYAYAKSTADSFDFYPRLTFGVKTVVPQDFYNAKEQNKFYLVDEEINRA